MALKADNIQVALFTRPGTPQPDALQVWTFACKDSSPDAFQRGNNTPMSISTASGSFQGYNISIHSQLGRVDIFVSAIQSEGNVFPPVQIENTYQALQIVQKISSQAIVIVKPLRVALICSLTEFLESMDDVAARLKQEIGDVSFPDKSSDHIYQYNVPKKSDDHKLMSINRIVTYGSGLVQQLSGTIGPMGSNMSISQERSVITLKIDINSLPNHDITAVANDVLVGVVSEMDFMVRGGVKTLS